MPRARVPSRVRKSVLLGSLIGCLSALLSAWIPVLWWTTRADVEWVWIDPSAEHATPEIDRFASPELPRPKSRYELQRTSGTPTTGMLLQRTDYIEGSESFGADAFVVTCAGVRGGWPWTTMRGAIGTCAVDQHANPDPSRTEERFDWAVRLPPMWSSARVRVTPMAGDSLLPLQPTIGFAAHAGIVGGLVTGGMLGFGARRSNRRRARGLCPDCGYARDEQEICPECGSSSG